MIDKDFIETQKKYLEKHPERKYFDKTMTPYVLPGLVVVGIFAYLLFFSEYNR